MFFIQNLIACQYDLKQHLHTLVETGKTDTKEFAQLNLKLIQLQQLSRFIAHGHWSGPQVRETLLFWVKSNYDNALTAQRYKLSDSAIRDLIIKSDKILVKNLDRPLRDILAGRIYEGMTAFYFNTSKIEKNQNKERRYKNGKK